LAEWTRLASMLVECGVLTGADLRAFGDYCRVLTDTELYEAQAKEAGPELAIAKGYQGMVIKLRAQANQLRVQLGLTPSARSTVKAVKKGAKAESPGARYLNALQGGKA